MYYKLLSYQLRNVMPLYNSIVVLTGAGVSAESGIKTFRAADGLWENHRIEDVASPEGFARNPHLVQRFYNERRQHLLNDNIQPNPAHKALAELEKKFSGKCLLVTQNIDNLHEQGGSKNIIHMHGELLKMRCIHTGNIYQVHQNIQSDTRCACCRKTQTLRPHIVWFGEIPMAMEDIYLALQQCDLFISIGTSGNVYPAAGFVQLANQANAHTVELNLEPSQTESMFKEKIYGSASKIVPEYVQYILTTC